MPELKPCPNQKCHGRTPAVIKEYYAGLSCNYGYAVKCGCGLHGEPADTAKKAMESWNALPRALTWTNEPPKVAGWYWWDNGHVQSLARVRIIDGKLSMTDYGCRDVKIRDCDLVERWAGPIAPPVEG